jgi:hypothetical protein
VNEMTRHLGGAIGVPQSTGSVGPGPAKIAMSASDPKRAFGRLRRVAVRLPF